MEVRTERVAGLADKSDNVAFVHHLTGADVKPGAVCVQRGYPAAVVDQYIVSVARVPLSAEHLPAVGCID